MKNLIENDFPAYYGVTRRFVSVEHICSNLKFDVRDSATDFIVPYTTGDVSFQNRGLTLSVINYDHYLDKFKPLKIEDGKKRCDFIITDSHSDELVLLCEISSATGTYENLEKPILHKKTKQVLFPRGKYEKAEIQLYDTLANIMPVPSIHTYVNTKARKICLMGYSLKQIKEEKNSAKAAFNRGRMMEAVEAGENGAQVSCPPIESFGFTYFRISHQYVFNL